MLNKVITLLVLTVASFPSWGVAQGDDRREVILEALRYMHKDLGAKMVVHSAHLTGNEPGHAAFVEALKTEGLRTADPKMNRRCSGKGYAYFAGPERYVSFKDPEISGNVASARVFWTFSSQKPGATIVDMATTLHLEKSGNRWVVVREQGREHLDTMSRYCKPGK
jgi:hypothetical protein